MSSNFQIFTDGIDITGYAGNVSWQNTIDELATSLSFEIAKTDTRYLNFYAPKEGSSISIVTNTEIFRGILLSIDDGSKTVNKYTACDFGWYLNKSSETYQFNKMPARKAIIKICDDYGIPIETIPDFKTEITQLYLDKALSDIIKDILNLCGGGYNLDVTPNGIRIYKLGDIYAYPEFRITPNTHLLYSPTLRGNVSHSVSIEELKNSIKIVTEKDKVYSHKKTLKDEESIKKYGFLQKVVKIDPEKENANTVANTQLSELNRATEKYSCEIIEAVDSYTRAGSVIGIEGVNYLIEGSGHSIKNGIHYVKLDLRKFPILY